MATWEPLRACTPPPTVIPVGTIERQSSLTFQNLLRVVAEVVVRHVVNSATTAAAGHLRLAVALEAHEPSLAVRVAIAIALAFATLLASRAAGTAPVDESACCACTMMTLLSVSYKFRTR